MPNSERDSPLLQFIGTSTASQQARERAVISAASGLPVLIRGEPGVGKTHLARCIKSLPLGEENEVPLRTSEIDFALFHADEMVHRIVGRMVEDDEVPPGVVVRSAGWLREREHFSPGPIFSNRLIVRNLQKATAQIQAYLLTALRDYTVIDPRGTVHDLGRPWQLIVLQRPGEENVLPDLGRALLSGIVIDIPPFVIVPTTSRRWQRTFLVREDINLSWVQK